MPFSVLSDEGIGEDDELSCDGNVGELCGFSFSDQVVVASFHGGVESGGADGCEIEAPPDAGSAAEDDTNALSLSGIVGDRREACEEGCLLAVQGAELGKIGDEGCGGDEAEAWDGGENVIACAEARVGSEAGQDLGIDGCDILAAALDAAFELAREELSLGLTELVLESCLLFDCLAASRYELGELLERFWRWRRGWPGS